jgi:hypothetical protein
METVSLNRLNLGMTPDPRDRATGVSRVLKHFDTTQKQKLTPYRDMVLDASVETTLDVFQITRVLQANGNYFGFGQISATDAHAQVYVKTIATDPTTLWVTAVGGSDASFGGARNDAMFKYYKTTNKIYGGNNTGVWSYDLGALTFAFNENTSIKAGPALIHPKDDTMYVLSGNVIATNNNGSWNSSALALPSDITSGDICEDGNYLSIAVNRLNGNVVEYLWDRDSSLTTLADSIDWGTGTLLFIENLGGVKVGVFVENSLIPKLILKYNTGTEIVTIAEFQCSLATVGTWKQKYNNSLLFLAELTIDGQAHKGLWKLERTSTGFVFCMDRLPRNDVAVGANSLKGFYRSGDYVFISYLNPVDSKFTIWRTDSNPLFLNTTSIVQTTINPGMPEADRTKMKKLMAVALSTDPLPSGASATLKYRVDNGAWTPILTETTEGNITTEQVIDASGTQFTDGREYEFAVESLGGAEITEVKYKYQTVPTNI